MRLFVPSYQKSLAFRMGSKQSQPATANPPTLAGAHPKSPYGSGDRPHPKSEGKESGEAVGQEGEPDVRHTAMLIPEMPSDSAVLHIPL